VETPTVEVRLRDVTEHDIPVFHEHQLAPAAQRMVAFTTEDPSDREAFEARRARTPRDEAVTKKTILVGGRVAGNIGSFVAPWSGKPEVGWARKALNPGKRTRMPGRVQRPVRRFVTDLYGAGSRRGPAPARRSDSSPSHRPTRRRRRNRRPSLRPDG
jgi:hypothetical protein